MPIESPLLRRLESRILCAVAGAAFLGALTPWPAAAAADGPTLVAPGVVSTGDGDGGLLFGLALAVTLLAATVVALRRTELVRTLRRFP